jgi:hypothetical protein
MTRNLKLNFQLFPIFCYNLVLVISILPKKIIKGFKAEKYAFPWFFFCYRFIHPPMATTIIMMRNITIVGRKNIYKKILLNGDTNNTL